MPIYEYKCNACEHRLEKLQRMSDDLLTICPECNKPELIKLVSAAGFRLKGSGWYETDFKNKPNQPNKNQAAEPAKKSTSDAAKTPSSNSSKTNLSKTSSGKG